MTCEISTTLGWALVLASFERLRPLAVQGKKKQQEKTLAKH
jgi:hypothetical protein